MVATVGRKSGHSKDTREGYGGHGDDGHSGDDRWRG
jgi:hypothetical protein